MIKKIYLIILTTLITFLAVYLTLSTTEYNFYFLANMGVTVLGIIIYLLYIFNMTKSPRLLAIGNFTSFYAVLTLCSLIGMYISAGFIILGHTNNIGTIYFAFQMGSELAIYLSMMILFYRRELYIQLKDFIRNLPKYIIIVITAYVGCILLNYMFVQIANLIPASSSTPANQQEIEAIMQNLNIRFMFILSIVLVAPIVEEFIFRYLLIERVFLKIFKVDTTLKIIGVGFLSGLIFATYHAMAADTFVLFVRDLLLYIGTSFGLSLAYISTRNIFVTISIHMFTNTISVILMLGIAAANK